MLHVYEHKIKVVNITNYRHKYRYMYLARHRLNCCCEDESIFRYE